MKVLICHNYYKVRGGEDEVVDFEKELLNKNSYEVMEYFKKSCDINGRTKNFRIFLSMFFSLKTVFELKKIIKTSKPDVAHIHNIFPIISPSVYYVLKKNNIPIIQTMHNYRFYCSNGLGLKNNQLCDICLRLSFKNIFQICSEKKVYDLLLKIIIYFMRKFKIFNKINFFIAPSEFMKNSLIKFKINEEKIILKRNSTNIAKYQPKNIGKKENYFTFIGRLSYEKGIMDLIEVFKDLKYISLKIFGDGPLKVKISTLINQEKLKNIKLMGFVTGKIKIDYIYNSKANIIPSICNEAASIILVECLKLGTPVIGSNMGAIPEFIREGYNGYIYNYRSLDMLKEKIIKICNLSEKEKKIMQNNCLNSFNDFFDLSTNFNIIKNIYANFL
jgi:glycosyltransferase involved in cell wall biosynthesis